MHVVDGREIKLCEATAHEAVCDLHARLGRDVYVLNVVCKDGVCADYYFDGIEELQFLYRCAAVTDKYTFLQSYDHVKTTVRQATRCMEERDINLDSIVLARERATSILNGVCGRDFACYAANNMPRITSKGDNCVVKPGFKGMDNIGFYVIVPDEDWFELVAGCGVRTVQLRAKGRPLAEVERMVEACSLIAEKHGTRLIVNDYWDLAIKYGAYGVHLGQEDMGHADFDLLLRSGIRLGISTHCYHELARANFYGPSYIGFGPIYQTTSKDMRFFAQGVELLRKWVKISECPVVAIGGITLSNVYEVTACRAEGTAVISAVTGSNDPEDTIKRFIDICCREPGSLS
ncbi:thiamine phosphate synthase [Candidatus Anaplasma sp. TIGMIC]|uniref:thiamine phosphate synthase n=1 Tax=Candidatus Anaplasma sp. TIGMIC TaxID=3020713 RepID=UPI00232EB4CE|nr:thiamine phosphate synthase [Candidatus Anaplasma sp. TIGMIC]MDB1135047.1 thiamine phosphate synthase [Candidatus Anaplasma sp. TIGMIC]